jgi:hypothetical protein
MPQPQRTGHQRDAEAVLAAALETSDGRFLVMSILASAWPLEPGRPDDLNPHFTAGRRAVTQTLLDRCLRVAPKATAEMMQEAYAREHDT